jgi:hypothetical protein
MAEVKGRFGFTQSRKGRQERFCAAVEHTAMNRKIAEKIEMGHIEGENELAYSHPQLCPFPTRCKCIELPHCGIFTAIMIVAVSEAKQYPLRSLRLGVR